MTVEQLIYRKLIRGRWRRYVAVENADAILLDATKPHLRPDERLFGWYRWEYRDELDIYAITDLRFIRLSEPVRGHSVWYTEIQSMQYPENKSDTHGRLVVHLLSGATEVMLFRGRDLNGGGGRSVYDWGMFLSRAATIARDAIGEGS